MKKNDLNDDIPQDIFFIFQPFKNFIKVTAIDSLSKIEASVSAPKSLSQEQMKELGFKRLLYVLKKYNEKK